MKRTALPKTALQTHALFSSGLAVAEIARKRNCVTNTIESHLVDCLRAGLPVDISQLVSTADRAEIEKAIDKHGAEKLKPIHDSLPETITYNMIRFVIAKRLRSQKAAK